VSVIEKSKSQNLKLGSDYGIIFYNETPLKDRKKKWNHYYFYRFWGDGQNSCWNDSQRNKDQRE
jgi:hypothetical protein